jgi:hypothetical protein
MAHRFGDQGAVVDEAPPAQIHPRHAQKTRIAIVGDGQREPEIAIEHAIIVPFLDPHRLRADRRAVVTADLARRIAGIDQLPRGIVERAFGHPVLHRHPRSQTHNLRVRGVEMAKISGLGGCSG